MAPQAITNWAVDNSFRPKEVQYELAHLNDGRELSVAAAYIVCVAIILLAVIMRFVSRRIGRIKYEADDWTMVVALVLIPSSSPQYLPIIHSGSLVLTNDRLWLLRAVLRTYWVRSIPFRLNVFISAACVQLTLPAAFMYGNAHHAVLMTENDPFRLANVCIPFKCLFESSLSD